MIKSFGDKHTAALFSGTCPRRFLGIRTAAERKLTMIDVAASLASLRSPPGNRFESMRGKRLGQYSVRINDQWRVCFRWIDGDAFDVEVVDYH